MRSNADIEGFLHKPEIFRYAAEHGAGLDLRFTNDDPSDFWLGFYVEEGLVGIINAHHCSGCAVAFHPYILREFKGLFLQMNMEFFSWAKENMPSEVIKLNAVIPEIYANTIKAAKLGGMTVEGRDTASYRHDKGVCDRIMMGIKMREIDNG